MRIFYILILILCVSLHATSQTRPGPDTDRVPVSIKFYPNPATSVINFEFQQGYDKSYSFQIFSFVGKKVFELNNITPKTVVNLTDFYRGLYIFQLRDKNGKIIDSGKFQVSR